MTLFFFFFFCLSQLQSHFSIQTIGSDASCISNIPTHCGLVHENRPRWSPRRLKCFFSRLSDSDHAHLDVVLKREFTQNWYFTNFHTFSNATLFKMWIKTLMGTHNVQSLHSLPAGTQLLSNHSCCFLAQCKDRQEQQQQQHLQDKRVNEKDGQMIKLEEGEKRRDSEVGTFDRAEADFLF